MFEIWFNDMFSFNVLLLVLIIPNSGPHKVATRGQVTVQPCGTWETALSKCKLSRADHWIPVILDRDGSRFVHNQMASRNISTTWLGLRREHLGQFMWLDCSLAPETFAKQPWGSSRNCAFLNTRQQQLDAGQCFVQKGVICEVNDCAECSLLDCADFGERCFYKTCTGMTWATGRAYCRSRGWDLAVLGRSEEGKLREFTVSSSRNSSCLFYWVGLRREEWVYPNTTSENITKVHWAPGEPGLSGDCAIMSRKGKGHEWRAVSCTERHQALCFYQQLLVTTYTSKHAILQSCRPWQAASSTCDTVREHFQLPVITNIEDFRSISQAMYYYKVNVTWLPLTKHQLKTFLWLDCKPAPSDFTAQKWSTTTNCAFLNVRHNSLQADKCSSLKGVICEIKDCSECALLVNCIYFGARCFYKTCTTMTWEAGRAYCKSRAWDLAVLGSTFDWSTMRQILVSAWKDSSCKIFWLGLRREEWVYPKNAHLTLTREYWDRSEPRSAGQCSVMIKTQDGYRWRAADCNDRYPAICVKLDAVEVTSTRPQSPSKQPQTQFIRSTQHIPKQMTVKRTENVVALETYHNALNILIPLTVVSLLLLVGASIYIFIRKGRNKKILWKLIRQTEHAESQ